MTNVRKAYLSAILDLAYSSIVSYVLDEVIITNSMATPLFHSNFGFQYTNKTFKFKLDAINAKESMSRVDCCIGNGSMERFFGTLKSEMYYLRKFDTYEELKQAINEYIKFYNTKRLQRKLKVWLLLNIGAIP